MSVTAPINLPTTWPVTQLASQHQAALISMQAHSEMTRCAYEKWIQRLRVWMEDRSLNLNDLSDATLGEWVHDLAAQGLAPASVSLAVSAAAWLAKSAHLPPVRGQLVADSLRIIRRDYADRAKPLRKPLDAEAVARVRGHINGQADSNEKSARDMALISVLAEGGLRRSEAAALDWNDLQTAADGSGRLTIRRSKTDQESVGAVVAISAQAMTDLERLASLRRNRHGSIFGIEANTINCIVKRITGAAGLGTGYTAHSGRIGMAQRMTKNSAPSAAIMRQGRWASSRMIATYTRSLDAGEAVRYL